MAKTFRDSCKSGGRGEEILYNYWCNKGYAVSDLRYEREWQKVDVDYRVRTHKGEYLVDVKSDTYSNINFAIELVSNTNKNTDGNIKVTVADRWYYYFLDTNICYVFNPKDMLAFVNENLSENVLPKGMRIVHPYTAISNGNGYHSKCVLVPISLAYSNGLIQAKFRPK